MSLIDWAAVIMVGAGALFMVLSIIKALGMLSRLTADFRKRWAILIFFKGFFFLGYVAFIVIIVKNLQFPVALVTGAVFLGGAFFVFLITRLTKYTVGALADKEEALHELNVTLEQKVKKRTESLNDSMKKLEIEVKEREKANRKVILISRELRLILDTISTGIRVTDLQHRVKQVNKRFCQFTELSREELLKSYCYENFKGGDCRGSHDCGLRIMQKEGDYKQGIVVKTSKSEKLYHFHITTAPLLNSQGKIVGILEDFQDVTSLVLAQKEKEQAQNRLQQAAKLESVGQLAAGIAHEINTPMQFIGTNIDFIGESFADLDGLMEQVKEAIKEDKGAAGLKSAFEEADWDFLAEEIPLAIKQSKEGVARVSKLVQAMKEFSHPGTREMAPADINAIIENTITISHNELKQVADLTIDFDKELPLVPCMTDEIGQVFLNMLINAGHAIADKVADSSEKGKITIITKAEDEMVNIQIQDTGSGMSEEVCAKIFDPFFTTKEVGSGSGQGLSIANDIVVNKHHGEIKVESTPGQGTTFIIRLPLQKTE